jgi:hypothetical protein
MNERPLIVVHPHPAISPQEARDARARAWKFIFDFYRKKAAGIVDDHTEGESKNGSNPQP